MDRAPGPRSMLHCEAVRILASIVLAAVLLVPLPTRAQPSQSEMAAARRLFRSGLASARRGDWEDALRDFERSYAVAAVPTTLLNLAGAQVETGRLIAGAESYRRFLSEATAGRAAQYRGQAEEALESVEGRIPQVRIDAPGFVRSDEIRVDDGPVSSGVVGIPLPLDPGEHHVVLRRRGSDVASATFTLAEGQTHNVRLVIRDASGSLPAVEDGEDGEYSYLDDGEVDEDEGGGVLSSPWFWTGVGVAVVGAVVVTVLVTSGGEGEPYTGNLGPGLVAF